ncbi:MAG: Xaa-Pro peptidase family protein [Caldilineaceae bacterium]
MSNTFGRHRAKINAFQTISAETQAHLTKSDGLDPLIPSQLALASWQAKGLPLPDFDVIRRYRLQRIRQKLVELDYAGIVVFDPINIRYATDSRNLQVWLLHNPMRYCFIATEGPVVLFEFARCEHLAQHLDLIDEIRLAQPWSYMAVTERVTEVAEKWASELADLVKQHGGGNRRLAIDRCNPEGTWALQRLGIEVCNGEEVMELARAIKCAEEIKAMRCAITAGEDAIRVMQSKLEPGITEQRLWSYLHAESIARGGEWLETRLLTSGPRTNPWYQECGDRVIEAGDLVAFDTDLIGTYGICVDISRTWLCGDGKPTAEQRQIYQMAYEQIQCNQEILRPGKSFRELAEQAKSLAPDYFPNRYSLLYHGVGLADEYPGIFYKEDLPTTGFEGIVEANMVLCVESYVGRVGGKEGVKLEEQLLVTEDGVEPLSAYPYEHKLLY